ncbi:MAG TPA: ABC transporter substrate-binding protein [Usitatibacter sp.]|jgi:branched-chain amino acid transport system substrate-binding protein|nr:ABC transporter substrate-binding protein [Usitatibacter sp.]
MKREFRIKAAALLLAAAGALGATVDAAAQSSKEIFVPVLVYRTGAYAPNGVPWADGFVDYLKLVNARDGGVNGVKIAYEECETGYATDRGVECYERLKSKHPVAFSPLSTGITYALTDKVYGDHIVLITAGYGRADSVDGAVFRWNFPMMGTYWDGADILVQHVKEKGSLKGKKIALVYHDSPYGKEPIPVLEALAKREGFELLKLPVTAPGVEQKATWLQIRQQRPDYVFVWGWGVMNSTALKEAIAVSYPRAQIYGVWWSAAEPDVVPAEAAAKGYNGLALGHSSEHDRPIHKEMIKYLYDKGQGTANDKGEVGSVLYNRGMLSAMLTVESIRSAQKKFGNRVVTGDEVRWGAEHVSLDAARIKALGVEGMLQPVHTSCADHGGSHAARIHTWDGGAWSYTSEMYKSEPKLLDPMIKASAEKYAAEKKLPIADCGKSG